MGGVGGREYSILVNILSWLRRVFSVSCACSLALLYAHDPAVSVCHSRTHLCKGASV